MATRAIAAAVVTVLLLAACGSNDAAEPTATSTISAPAPDTTAPDVDSPPGYLRFGAGRARFDSNVGLQRIVDGNVEVLVAEEGVWWAADDRAGGVVFSFVPSGQAHEIWRIPVGASSPVLVAESATPTGSPIVAADTMLLPVTQHRSLHGQTSVPESPDCRGQGYLDIDTGQILVLDDCVETGEQWTLPVTAVDTLALHENGRVTTVGEGDLPAPSFAFAEPITGEPIDVPGNPYPTPCYACILDPILAPDGQTLAIGELIPTPRDLGLTNWDEVHGLSYAERWSAWAQWANWERSEAMPRDTVRIVDLSTGDTIVERPFEGSDGDKTANLVTGFDGRHLSYTTIADSDSTTDSESAWTSTIIDLLGDGETITEDGWRISLLYPHMTSSRGAKPAAVSGNDKASGAPWSA